MHQNAWFTGQMHNSCRFRMTQCASVWALDAFMSRGMRERLSRGELDRDNCSNCWCCTRLFGKWMQKETHKSKQKSQEMPQNTRREGVALCAYVDTTGSRNATKREKRTCRTMRKSRNVSQNADINQPHKMQQKTRTEGAKPSGKTRARHRPDTGPTQAQHGWLTDTDSYTR